MAGKLTVILIHISALWSNLIVPCVTVPENWKYCTSDWDVWLYPELVRGWEMITKDPCIYCEEKEKLNDSIQ